MLFNAMMLKKQLKWFVNYNTSKSSTFENKIISVLHIISVKGKQLLIINRNNSGDAYMKSFKIMQMSKVLTSQRKKLKMH